MTAKEIKDNIHNNNNIKNNNNVNNQAVTFSLPRCCSIEGLDFSTLFRQKTQLTVATSSSLTPSTPSTAVVGDAATFVASTASALMSSISRQVTNVKSVASKPFPASWVRLRASAAGVRRGRDPAEVRVRIAGSTFGSETRAPRRRIKKAGPSLLCC